MALPPLKPKYVSAVRHAYIKLPEEIKEPNQIQLLIALLAIGTVSLLGALIMQGSQAATGATVPVETVFEARSGVSLSGDANGDSRINALDVSILLSKDGRYHPVADFNNDGVVGAADMAILLGKWSW